MGHRVFRIAVGHLIENAMASDPSVAPQRTCVLVDNRCKARL